MQTPKLISIHEEGLRWRESLEVEERRLESALRKHMTPSVFVCDLSPAPEFAHEERGVYLAPYLSRRGRRVMYAVDRAGRYVARMLLDDPAGWREAESSLIEALDRLDPSPVQLVP